MATEQEVTRSTGFAVIRVGKGLTTDEVGFARDGDLLFLGAHLEVLKPPDPAVGALLWR